MTYEEVIENLEYLISGDCTDYDIQYVCPDGERSYTYEDAVLHTIDWLNAERSDEVE